MQLTQSNIEIKGNNKYLKLGAVISLLGNPKHSLLLLIQLVI